MLVAMAGPDLLVSWPLSVRPQADKQLGFRVEAFAALHSRSIKLPHGCSSECMEPKQTLTAVAMGARVVPLACGQLFPALGLLQSQGGQLGCMFTGPFSPGKALLRFHQQ